MDPKKVIAYALIVKGNSILAGRKLISKESKDEKGVIVSYPTEGDWTLPKLEGLDAGSVNDAFKEEIFEQTGLDVLVNNILGKSDGPSNTAFYVLCEQRDITQNPVPGTRFFNLEFVPYEDLFEKYLSKKKGPGWLAPPEVKITDLKYLQMPCNLVYL